MTHLYALLGSILWITFLIWQEKQRRDSNGRIKQPWGEYFSKQWDDFGFAVIAGQLITFVQKPLVFAAVYWFKKDLATVTKVYTEVEYVVSFAIGAVSAILIEWGYGKLKNKLKGKK